MPSERRRIRLPDGLAPALCEMLGLAVISYGLFMFLPWLGVIAAGLSLLAVGFILGE